MEDYSAPSFKKHHSLITEMNFFINIVAFVLLIFLTSTGLLLYLELPPWKGGAMLLGMTRHEWGWIHFILSLMFIVTTSVHLMAHGHWIVCVIKSRIKSISRWRILVVFFSVIFLFAIACIPFFSPITYPENRDHFEYGQRGDR